MKNKKILILVGVVLVALTVFVVLYVTDGNLFQGRLSFFKGVPSQTQKIIVDDKRIDEVSLDPSDELLTADVPNVDVVKEADTDFSKSNLNDDLELEVGDDSLVEFNSDIRTKSGSVELAEVESGVDVSDEWPVTEPTIVSLGIDPVHFDPTAAMLQFEYETRGFDSNNGTVYFNIESTSGNHIILLPEVKHVGNGARTLVWGRNQEGSDEEVSPGSYVLIATGQTADGEAIKGAQLRFEVGHRT